MSLEYEPFVLKNIITEGNFGLAAKWNPQIIGNLITDIVDVKILPIYREINVNSNNDSTYLHIKSELNDNHKFNLKQLDDWFNRRDLNDELLKKYSPSEYSSYAGYKHLDDSVKCKISGKAIKEYINFKNLIGQLKSRGRILANPPTLWVSYGPDKNENHKINGTEKIYRSSCTPLHYDTYGCNVVAQIFGRKRWTLFSPGDTQYLYPTRIPYEESSVLSSVDLRSVDLKHFPLYSKATPYTITLEPGDMLFVPKHWWHFVECQSPETISLNCWIDTGEDDKERFKEILVSHFLHNNAETNKIPDLELDSNEMKMDREEHMQILNLLHGKCHSVSEKLRITKLSKDCEPGVNKNETDKYCDTREDDQSTSNGYDVNSSDSDESDDNDTGNEYLEDVRDSDHLICNDNEIDAIYDVVGNRAVRTSLRSFGQHPLNHRAVKRRAEYKPLTEDDILRAITEPNVIDLIVANLNKINK